MPEVIKSKAVSGNTSHCNISFPAIQSSLIHVPLQSRDLVPLCKNCHLKYERFADAYKDATALEYDMPLEGRGWILTPENSVVRKAASAVVKYRDGKLPFIPLERIQYLQYVVENWKAQEGMDMSMDEVLLRALELTDRHKGPDFVEHGEYVVAKLMKCSTKTEDTRVRWPDLEEFVKSWRRHFLEHCNCKYLSAKWSVDADIYIQQPL